jgi:plastocyanin/subtilisin family serine protease
MDRQYVVTLHDKNDLGKFYNEMQLTGFPLVLKRPMSRNTHYMMTEDQAERLRQDPRVWGVEAVDSFKIKRQVINNEPYNIIGDFWKAGPANVSPTDLQWGHIHCAGDQAQRGKGQFGPIASGYAYEEVNGNVEIFNSGKHVDVVIVDDPVSYDSEEWYSPSSNQTRFVQYQWFTELNTAVGSIDDDGQSLPTGTITYGTNAATSQFHGNHVAGTTCGQYYGWAREANIYNMAVTDPWPSGQQLGALLIFDYLRAFHLNKPINPETGKKNPTITNHSYGGVRFMPNDNLQFADVSAVEYRGITYSAGSPGPSGWTQVGLEADFGLRFGLPDYPLWSSAVAADVQDAIDDGIVVIGAAGNDNLLIAGLNDVDWNNTVSIIGVGTFPYNRGAWPITPDSGAICVGSVSKQADFRRSTYTQFGPGIDIFAPGDNILSAFGNGGTNDIKYTQGSGNYFYYISGTSMASPQVAGVISCLATGKERFTQASAKKYLNDHSIYGDMTFNINPVSPAYYYFYLDASNNNAYLVSGNDKNGSVNGSNPTITANVGDDLNFNHPQASSYSGISGVTTLLPPRTLSITVTAPTSTYYTLSGFDYNGLLNGNNITVLAMVGDTLEFNLSNVAASHPFYIRDAAGTSNVTTPAATNQGSTGNATVTWTPNTAGTYSYVCGNHSSMKGTITVIPVSPDGYLIAVGDRVLDGSQGDQIDPTINIEYGDGLDMELYADLSSHPIYLRDSNNNNIANVYNQGASAAYTTIGWDRADCPAVGTYKYVCGNHSIMSGDIVIHPAGTYWNHPLYIKTVQGSGTGNQVSGATNQGSTSGNVGWTPNTPGTFYYQCGLHSAMYGEIVIESTQAGTFIDPTCQKGSPNLYLHAKNPRKDITGMISEQVGNRSTGLTFPRTATFNRPAPAPVPPASQTYTFTVGNSGASHYTFTGTDSITTHSNANDPAINCNAGDTLVFNVSASGHPFYVKTSATTGTGNQVSTGTITGQGTVNGAVTWDTTGVTPGLYYYICQFHSGMVGQIIIL